MSIVPWLVCRLIDTTIDINLSGRKTLTSFIHIYISDCYCDMKAVLSIFFLYYLLSFVAYLILIRVPET